MPGISGLETLLPLLLKLVQENDLDLMTAIRCVTQNPARILGVQRGSLEINQPADLSILNPEGIWTLKADEMLSEGQNTPFQGWEFIGQVEQTFFQGRSVYRNNQV